MSARPATGYRPLEASDRVATSVERLPWQRFSACHDEPSHMFFELGMEEILPESTSQKAQVTQGHLTKINAVLDERARKVCRSCPVQVDCLEYAMDFERRGHAPRHGIFGGLSAAERSQLEVTQMADTCRTPPVQTAGDRPEPLGHSAQSSRR